MQQISKITQPFPNILTFFYSGESLACPGLPDQTQLILHDLSKVSKLPYLTTCKKWILYLQ